MNQLQKSREDILALEGAIRKLPQLEPDLHHHFAPGVYARELRLPKGTVLTGKIHKTEHLNIISAGKIAVQSENGNSVIIEAPHTMVSKPGTKRAGYALEDTVWTTIHVTDETDLEIIEEQVIAKTFEEVDALLEQDSRELLSGS